MTIKLDYCTNRYLFSSAKVLKMKKLEVEGKNTSPNQVTEKEEEKNATPMDVETPAL